MLIKQVIFRGQSDSGVHCQGLFTGLDKTASADAFDGWDTADEIRSYIKTITSEDRQKYCYVLVNALGAGEYFGSNINADYFCWAGLSHEGEDYGYKTFLNAHAYQHHVNKDPEKSFGIPVLSVLNHRMKRVELIIRLDREKAKLVGAADIIARIDAGEFPDVSMGCKVPYDVCRICGNQSKTREDYCIHMRPPEELRHLYGPNKLMPDGRRICVDNLTPRFFDISFVFIGADKTAKVMAKLASVDSQICLGEVCTLPTKEASAKSFVRIHDFEVPFEHVKLVQKPQTETRIEKQASTPCCDGCGDKEKAASAFRVKSAAEKVSEIIKRIPVSQFAMKRVPAMAAAEPCIPPPVINDLASNHSLGEIAGTLGSAGIALKPREFQKIILIKIGMADWAERLENENKIFRRTGRFDYSVPLSLSSPNQEILSKISSLIPERTIFGESFIKRAFVDSRKKVLPTEQGVTHSLLDKISAAYNGYRRGLLTKISQATAAVQSDPKLKDSILRSNLVNMFSKTANAPLVSIDSVAYLMGAHLDGSLLSSDAVIDSIASSNHWLLNEGL